MDRLKLYGSTNLLNDLHFDYRIKTYKIVNGDNYIAEDYDNLAKSLKQHINSKPNFLSVVLKKAQKDIKRFQKVWGRIHGLDAKLLSREDLSSCFNEYIKTLHELMAYLFLPLSAERILTEKIQEILIKRLEEEKIELTFQKIAVPTRHSLIQEESIAFLKLVRKAQKKNIESLKTERGKKLFEKHLAEWAWLGDHFFLGRFWTMKDLSDRFEESKTKDCSLELMEFENRLKNQATEAKSVCKELGLSRNEIGTIKLAQRYIDFRTFRLDVLFLSEYLVKDMLDAVAAKLHMDYECLVMLSSEEINHALQNNDVDFMHVIKDRKKNYAIIVEDYVVSIQSGDKAESLKEQGAVATGPIKGTIAFPGFVKGKARIIEKREDFDKLCDGDILVTHMTTPDFVPLIKRCAAIVTDEGGITCHAAIVSRELKKPCVIGTRVATKTLSDGDEVEVDAVKGYVRIVA